ncbi:unnamed protein product, partial [Debaryomyces fabryi]
MIDYSLFNNIKRYILEDEEGANMDIDIDEFEITKFDYRNIFGKGAPQNINHLEIVFKFFDIENNLDMDRVPQKHKWYFDDHQEEWKELF